MSQDLQEQGQTHFDVSEVIEACKQSFDFFAALCLPDVCVALFPPVYNYIVERIKKSVLAERDFSQFAIGLPRGHAKTTFLKIIVVMIILFTKRRFILIVCHTGALAENFISDVAQILDSPNITRVFGNWRTFQEIDRQELKTFRFQGRQIIIGGIGAGGTVRGLNVGNARPDIMIMDDIQSKEEAESPVVAKKLLTWFTGTLLKAKSPDGCLFLFCGNMYRDLKIDGSAGNIYTCLLRNLQLNKHWISIIVGAIKADGRALWEAVQPLEQLLRELENDISLGCAEVFYSEVQNDPQCGTGTHFDLSRLPPFDINEKLDLCVGKFLMIDPSLGKKKSDAQIIGEFNVYEKRPYLWDIHIKQVSAPELVKWILVKCFKENIPLVVAETVGYQGTLIQWFEEYSRNGFEYEGVRYTKLEGIHFKAISPEGRKKVSRIVAMLKSVMAGGLGIRPKCLSLFLNQVASFDPIKANNVDDILDVASYGEEIPILFPFEMIPTNILEAMADGFVQTGSNVVEDNCVF